MLKKSLIIFAVLAQMVFSFDSFGATTYKSWIDYTVNTTPQTTDYLVGIDNPSGTWALQNYTIEDLIILSFLYPGIDASGFSGNLTTSDNTIQKLADAFNSFQGGAPGASYLTTSSEALLSNETVLNSESALEGILGDVSNVFTNNDTIPESNIDPTIARDSELSTITPDSTDNTKAAIAAEVAPNKSDGIPSVLGLLKAPGTGTDGVYLIGPDTGVDRFAIKMPSDKPDGPKVLQVGVPSTTEIDGVSYELSEGSWVDPPGTGSGVPDGTSTNDILVWDGDSWEPMALTAHPDFSTLLNAFNSMGLNAFSWAFSTPSDIGVTYYINSTTASLAYVITDTSPTYAPASVQFQIDSGGYTGNDCTSVTDCDVTGLTENDTNTVQLKVIDDKTPTESANTGQSPEITIVTDTIAPVGVAYADGTHSGTGDSLTSNIDWTELYLDPDTVACTVTNATPTNPAITCIGNACATETLTPADNSSTVSCAWEGEDKAGNPATGTRLTQAFTYSVTPLAYFKLDSSYETTKIRDEISGTNIGSGADTVSFITGYDGNAAQASASSQSIVIDSSYVENAVTTISFYSYHSTDVGNNYAFYIADLSGDALNFRPYSSGTDGALLVKSNYTTVSVEFPKLTAGTPHFVEIILDLDNATASNKVKIWIDGAPVDTSGEDFSSLSGFGTFANNLQFPYISGTGSTIYIDELKFYDEIAAGL